MALVNAIHRAQSTLKLLVGWLRGIISCIAGDIRSKGGEEASVVLLRAPVNDLRGVLQGNRRQGESVGFGRKEWWYKGVNKEVEPDANNLMIVSQPLLSAYLTERGFLNSRISSCSEWHAQTQSRRGTEPALPTGA